ncbi:MAG: hypothetical protein Q7R96_02905 [Nanoarchaeota archaeon]|nr:hypothetical protein [Nanoarchaeota archaeon]
MKKSFIEHAKDVNKRYASVFKTLEEYDKTHKLPLRRYKRRVDLTIDAQLWNTFKEECKQKNVKMSNVIELWIKEHLKL